MDRSASAGHSRAGKLARRMLCLLTMASFLERVGWTVAAVTSLAFGYTTPSWARVDVETVLASNLTYAQTQALLELFRGAYATESRQEVRVVALPMPTPPYSYSAPEATYPQAAPVRTPTSDSAPPPAATAMPEGSEPSVNQAQAGASPEATQTPSEPSAALPPQAQQTPPAGTAPQPAPQQTPQHVQQYPLVQAPPPLGPPEERIELSFVALASRIQVRAIRYNQQGKVVHSVRTMLAEMDEAPEVLGRLAQALYALTSYEETATLDNITSEERRPPKHRRTEFVGGIRTSITIPYAPNQRVDGFGSLGFDGRLEADQYFVEFGAGAAIPIFSSGRHDTWNMGGVYADLGFNAYLTKTPISPYAGLGMQPRIWASNGGGGVSLLPYAQFGLMFMRDHSTRFYTELRAGYNVVPIGRTDDDEAVRPFEFAWAAGVGF